MDEQAATKENLSIRIYHVDSLSHLEFFLVWYVMTVPNIQLQTQYITQSPHSKSVNSVQILLNASESH